MHHSAKFHRDNLNGCGDAAIKIFQNGGRPPSWISKSSHFHLLVGLRCRVAPCITVKISLRYLERLWRYGGSEILKLAAV